MSDDVGYRRFLTGLDHPGLAEQLRPFILATGGHVIARRMAMTIAGECHCAAVADDLLTVVMDTRESNHMRDQAAGALEDAVPDTKLTSLEPLAKGEASPDPDDTIKGSALRRLIPKHWSVRGALPYITQRKNTHFMGTYEMFLRYELPKALSVDDLPDVLAWLRDKVNAVDTLNSLHKIASAGFAKALDNLDVPSISNGVADLWQIWLTRHDLHHLPAESEIRTGLAENESVRQRLAAMFLNHQKTTPNQVNRLRWPVTVIHGASSLEWLLDNIANAPVDRRPNWAAAIAALANDPDVAVRSWDKLLLGIEELPELKAQFEWLRSWDVKEPMARNAKAEWLRDKRRQAQFAKYDPVIPDSRSAIEAAFNKFSAGHHLAWIALWYQLILGSNGQEEHMLEPNLAACPNWQLLSVEQRERLPEIARAFLLSSARNEDHQHKTSINSLAASSAIWMLRDKLETDEKLRDAIRTSWLSTLVWHHDNSSARRELFELALELSPEGARSELMREAADEASQLRHPFAFRVAANAWSTELSTAAIEMIASSTDPTVVLNGLTEVAAHDLDAVIAYVESVLSAVTPNSVAYPIQLFGALVVGLSFAAEKFWSSAGALLKADSNLARMVIAKVSYGLDSERKGMLKRMSEAQLGSLYLLVRRTYPQSADPPQGEGIFVSAADTARQLRGQLPGILAARGTEAAAEELGKLADIFPAEATWFRWSQRQAVANVRRNLWQPPSPSVVKAMLERADARIISSDDELIELVLESLWRLQRRLTQQSLPRAVDLWLWEGAGLKRSKFRPKDEEALSDYVAAWLGEDLGPASGVVVNREVQPRRGARTDVIVEATILGSHGNFDKLTVVIEVKGCWHPAVRTGLETQLIEGYLKVHGWRCGIYLVGWFVCAQWETPVNNLQSDSAIDAAKEIEELAAGFDGINSRFRVRTCLLDCTLPSPKPPSS